MIFQSNYVYFVLRVMLMLFACEYVNIYYHLDISKTTH